MAERAHVSYTRLTDWLKQAAASGKRRRPCHGSSRGTAQRPSSPSSPGARWAALLAFLPSTPTPAVCSSCLGPAHVMVVRPVLNYVSFMHCWHARGETPVHVSCLPPRLGFPGAVAPAKADFPNKSCPSPQAAHFCHTLQLLDAPRLVQPPCAGTRLRVVPYFFFSRACFPTARRQSR